MYYLAYGSNLNVDQMKVRCPQAIVIDKVMIEDYRLLFRGSEGYAYLTIEKQQGFKVPAVIWQVTDSDIRNLDFYEGYPNFYRKKIMTFEIDGKKMDVFVYIMNEGYKLAIPSEYYYQGCLEGYKSFDFDDCCLKEAYDYCSLKQD